MLSQKGIRLVGWLLVAFSSLCILLLSLYNKMMPGPLIALLSFLAAVSLPFGATLSPLLSEHPKRKKYKRIYLLLSIGFAVIGALSKFLHLAGASIELIVAVIWYCFAFAPLELKDKYLKWLPFSKTKVETILLSVIDFLGINLLLLGTLFKLLHWPIANVLMSLGAIIILIGLFSWNQKFKNEVVRRKQSEDKIKEQFNEIHDSINYAKRIQTAILPPDRLVKEFLPECFILYQPKDIVAGDFYWLETSKFSSHGLVFFAAADCTGHGVPGALVSVICHNALNGSVREHGLIEPGKILDKTREMVIQAFEQSDEDVKDGMDISLLALNLSENQVKWSGANNPLWIVRNGSKELEEIKPDKQPIGKFAQAKAFTTHLVQLSKGDTIYIFTDGFQDQFGGDKEKKFKAAQFKSFLLSIQNQSLQQQKQSIQQCFDNWKGKLEQIDDVCVIGLRL
ncbi:MAG: SpoIIE family protein phosphatase [Bacteroidota bacterium]